MNTAPALERIKSHVAALENPAASRDARLMFWRLIADAALQAHELEVQEGDALNAVHADPQITAIIGEPTV